MKRSVPVLTAVAAFAIWFFFLVSLDAVQHWEPHRYCLQNIAYMVALTASSDLIIAIGYFILPVALIVIARATIEAYGGVGGAAGSLIVYAVFILSCGTGHLVDFFNEWFPIYYVKTSVNIITAFATVFAAIYFVPQAIRLTRALRDERVREVLQNALADS